MSSDKQLRKKLGLDREAGRWGKAKKYFLNLADRLINPRVRRRLKEVVGEEQIPKSIARVPQSYSYIKPGNVLVFNYPPDTRKRPSPPAGLFPKGPRVGFVVSSNRGLNGGFISTRNNPLLNIYKIQGVSPETLKSVIEIVYKKVEPSNYYKLIPTFNAIFGKNYYAFRTYNLRKMTNIYEVSF